MTSIHGTIQIGEATPTAKTTARRQRGGTWPFTLMLLALWIGGAAAGIAVARIWAFDTIASGTVGAVAGLLSYRPLCQALNVYLFRKTQTGKGIALDLPIALEAGPDAFVYRCGAIVSRAEWPAVTEVFYSKGWWVFMVQATPWYAAKRFFASAGDERAFLREVLSYMREEARARSGDALRFVQNTAA